MMNFFELKTIMRQKDDAPYAELLNRVREGKQTQADILFLQSQICKIDNRSNLLNVLHLFTTNDKVNEHNDYYLQHFDTDHCICEAVDYNIVDLTANAKQTVLNIANNLPPKKTQNLLRVLQIKLPVHNLVVVNIDTSDGLTNSHRNFTVV